MLLGTWLHPALSAAEDSSPAPYVVAVMVNASPGNTLVDALAAHDYSSPASAAPISMFREVPPRSVVAYHQTRPVGNHRSWLDAHPSRPEAKLDRFVVAEYDDEISQNAALAASLSDTQVSAAYAMPSVRWADGTAEVFPALAAQSSRPNPMDLLRVPAARMLAAGWALVGVVDGGLFAEHPSLRTTTTSGSDQRSFLSNGGVLPFFSANVMSALQNADNLSELQPQAVQFPGESLCDAADGAADGWLNFTAAGHGTHVAGLVAANGAPSSPRAGTCEGCGLAFVKASRLRCNFSSVSPRVLLELGLKEAAVGLGQLAITGSQVASMSFGIGEKPGITVPYCDQSEPGPANENPFCLELRAAKLRDVVVVAASGNARASALNFPARDPRVIAVGGVDAISPDTLWDFSPQGDLLSCPLSAPSTGAVTPEECGSNYSQFAVGDTARRAEFRQEYVAPAVEIDSTFHPGKNWHTQLQCGDAFGAGSTDDGFGQCTGTSMSAPMIAGIAGLLRSINPLLPAGDPFDGAPAVPGVRDALSETSSRAKLGLGWSSQLGFGLPNAGAAAVRVLGKVSGDVARKRLTPAFRLYSSGDSDYAATTNPQLAMSLLTMQSNNYASTSPSDSGEAFISGAAVRGYGSFPDGSGTPRAFAYFLSTNAPIRGVTPLPVFLLDRCKKALDPSCSGERDFLMLTRTADVQSALAIGYEYLGVQGYLFPPCQGAACAPPHMEALYLKCSVQRDDCAVVMESELATFAMASNGAYVQAFQQSVQMLGYAVSPTHSDGDDLPDGFEVLIGTSPIHTDSDGDGLSDSAEFPLAGLSATDPCIGPGPNACPNVFRDGLEEF